MGLLTHDQSSTSHFSHQRLHKHQSHASAQHPPLTSSMLTPPRKVAVAAPALERWSLNQHLQRGGSSSSSSSSIALGSGGATKCSPPPSDRDPGCGVGVVSQATGTTHASLGDGQHAAKQSDSQHLPPSQQPPHTAPPLPIPPATSTPTSSIPLSFSTAPMAGTTVSAAATATTTTASTINPSIETIGPQHHHRLHDTFSDDPSAHRTRPHDQSDSGSGSRAGRIGSGSSSSNSRRGRTIVIEQCTAASWQELRGEGAAVLDPARSRAASCGSGMSVQDARMHPTNLPPLLPWLLPWRHPSSSQWRRLMRIRMQRQQKPAPPLMGEGGRCPRRQRADHKTLPVAANPRQRMQRRQDPGHRLWLLSRPRAQQTLRRTWRRPAAAHTAPGSSSVCGNGPESRAAAAVGAGFSHPAPAVRPGSANSDGPHSRTSAASCSQSAGDSDSPVGTPAPAAVKGVQRRPEPKGVIRGFEFGCSRSCRHCNFDPLLRFPQEGLDFGLQLAKMALPLRPMRSVPRCSSRVPAEGAAGSEESESVGDPVPEISESASPQLLMHFVLNHTAFLFQGRNQQPVENLRYSRLPLVPAAQRAAPLCGLWRGTYGSHGVELLRVEAAPGGLSPHLREGETHPLPALEAGRTGAVGVVAKKITGDSFVVAGKTSFYMISPSAADIPPPAGVVVGRPFRLPAGYKTPVDLEQGVPHPTLVVQQVWSGFGQVADHGFRNPRWIPLQLVVFSEDCFGLLWLQLNRFSLMTRLPL
ncbi:MAG: hypothetical protein WDW38_003505 [Sanguina aurantia]